MDSLDRKIVAILQAEGRIKMAELSERVGLSPTPCARRVAILENAGVISGYSARVDQAKLGLPDHLCGGRVGASGHPRHSAPSGGAGPHRFRSLSRRTPDAGFRHSKYPIQLYPPYHDRARHVAKNLSHCK